MKIALTPFFLLFILALEAQPTYVLNTRYPVHLLDDYLIVLPDSTQNYSIEQIRQDTTLPFRPFREFKQPLQTRTVYWAKLQLRSLQEMKDWILQWEHWLHIESGWGRGNGKIDVYGYQDGELIFHKKTGSDYPKEEKEIKTRWNLNRVPLSLLSNNIISIILKVEGNSFGMPPYFNMTLCHPDHQQYHPLFSGYTFFNKFLFGVAFISFLYHLLLFFYLRQKVFIWFSVWLFFTLIAASMVIDVGLLSETILGNYPGIRLPLWLFAANSVWITFWFFGRSFVGIKSKYPRLDKAILLLCFLLFSELLISLFLLARGSIGMSSGGSLASHYMFLSLFTLFGMGIAVTLAFKKDLLARYFGVGAIFATLAPMIGGLWTQGLIELPFDPFVWGIFLQIVAYSFGLVYRQRKRDIAFRQAQDDLLEAEKTKIEMQRVKDLDELKTKFFANISHEFRTPLSLIMGPLNQSRNSNFTNRSDNTNGPITLSEKSYQIIKRNAERLQNLVGQLLELSKLESGHVLLNITEGGLVQFIRSAVFSFESLAERKNIHFRTYFPPEVEGAVYDKDKLEKIINNLLSNAFKYTPEGEEITVVLQTDGAHLTFEVSDTGKGMNKEEVEKVFERFYRVEGTEEKGSGIGLALTKELVELHNGQINIDSTVGKGTTFKVRLPYRRKNLPESILTVKPDAIIEEQTHLEMPASATLNQKADAVSELPVVLVVEDNTDLREFISDVLKDSYQVLKAADGHQGERMAFEYIPDVVISDVMMPKQDGYELCHHLKTNKKTSHIPIILLTAKAGQANKLAGLTQGADAYLTKPFDEKELLIRIKNLIAARQKIWEQFKASDLGMLPDLDIQSIDDQFLQQVSKTIKQNIGNEAFSVQELAREAGFSRSQLHRKLKALIGKSAVQLIIEVRLNHAKLMLEKKTGTVSEIAYAVGYSNLSHFSKSFKELFGVLPSKV